MAKFVFDEWVRESRLEALRQSDRHAFTKEQAARLGMKACSTEPRFVTTQIREVEGELFDDTCRDFAERWLGGCTWDVLGTSTNVENAFTVRFTL